MNDTLITCPHCGGEFALTEALAARLHAQFDARHEAELREAVIEAERRAQADLSCRLSAMQQQLHAETEKARAAETREIELRRKAMALEQAQAQAVEKARLEVEEKLRKEADTRTAALVAQAEKRAHDEAALEARLLEARLAEEHRKLEAAQQVELALREKAEQLDARAREIDLEIARKLDEKKIAWEFGLRQTLGLEQELKVKEKEKQIDDLRRVIDDLKRKSEQGSQELQGEVLELDIQAALENRFPHDLIRPVAKGAKGADLVQEVRNAAFSPCGSIVWEVKNTKHFSPAWIDKLKDDQRAAGASLAVLVSVVLPEEVRGFGLVRGVWVASLDVWPALAQALREQLIQVAFARAAAEGRHEKMEMLYQYLSGDEFRHRVEAIVETFTAMREQLERERRAMEKLWKEREKQIERVMINTVGMYGEMRGIVGQSMPEIAALELEGAAGLLEGEDQ